MEKIRVFFGIMFLALGLSTGNSECLLVPIVFFGIGYIFLKDVNFKEYKNDEKDSR